MNALEQYSRHDVLRIVGITPRQLSYWERLELVEPRIESSTARRPKKIYNFRHLLRLRTVKQLTGQKVPASRLRTALQAFRRWPGESQAALDSIRVLPAGRAIAVEYEGAQVEPVSGQLWLDFGGAGEAKVSSIRERSLEDWLNLALDCEGDPALRAQAIDAYRNIVERAPGWLEPKLNLGTLYYEEGHLEAAADEFRRAIEIAPGNPLAHFNFASVLDDLGELSASVEQFEEALRLAPGFADAHYNLARVYEKLGAAAFASMHWQRYLDLDPSSAWADFARERLATLTSNLSTDEPAQRPS